MIAEKGLACEERDVSLPQSEHKEPWFMRLNLGEEVPVIIHRDNIISDYDQIIDYVERTFTGGMLCPTGVDGVCHSSPLVSDTIFEPKQATESWAGLSVPHKKSQATLGTQMPSEPHTSSRHPREGRGPDNPGQLGYCPLSFPKTSFRFRFSPGPQDSLRLP